MDQKTTCRVPGLSCIIFSVMLHFSFWQNTGLRRTERQVDRETQGHSMYCASIASYSENIPELITFSIGMCCSWAINPMIEKTAIPAYKLVPKLTKLITIASLIKTQIQTYNFKTDYSDYNRSSILVVNGKKFGLILWPMCWLYRVRQNKVAP